MTRIRFYVGIFFLICGIFSIRPVFLESTSLPYRCCWSYPFFVDLNVGDIVSFYKGSLYLVKEIRGVGGDVVQISNNRIFINNVCIGVLTLSSAEAAKICTRLNMDVSTITGVIPQNYFFVSGKGDNSFDSRYFGLIHKNSIKRKYFFCHA